MLKSSQYQHTKVIGVTVGVDPTQSMGRCDSLLNERKMWVDFRILENPSSRRTVFPLSRHLLFVVIL